MTEKLTLNKFEEAAELVRKSDAAHQAGIQ